MGNMNELIAMVVFVSWNKLREQHLIMESSSLAVSPPLQKLTLVKVDVPQTQHVKRTTWSVNWSTVQGYLADQKASPPRPLQWDYA